MAGFSGLFDVDERLKRLSDLGDQLRSKPSSDLTEFGIAPEK